MTLGETLQRIGINKKCAHVISRTDRKGGRIYSRCGFLKLSEMISIPGRDVYV